MLWVTRWQRFAKADSGGCFGYESGGTVPRSRQPATPAGPALRTTDYKLPPRYTARVVCDGTRPVWCVQVG